jgi:hypothetical protein
MSPGNLWSIAASEGKATQLHNFGNWFRTRILRVVPWLVLQLLMEKKFITMIDPSEDG